jgi:surface protein
MFSKTNMKRSILTIILLLTTSPLFSQSITIGEDGIVRCKGVSVGTTRTIFGDVYEVVDRNLLIQRRNEGKDLTKVCVSNITDMNSMFSNSSFNQAIGNWDVSSVTTMRLMFLGTPFNKPIGNWDVSNVKDMTSMFFGSSFNQPIGNWNVSAVTNMILMFEFSSFNQPIGSWNVSAVTNMWRMFRESSFNQPIGNWDVSSVTDMREMFMDSKFNQPIFFWCVGNITVEPTNFSTNSPLTQQNKPIWATCPGFTPSKTIQLSPSINSTNVSRNASFAWNSDILSSQYQLQVFEGFDPIAIDTLVSDTTFVSPTSFIGNFVYNWRVRGFNETKKVYGEWSSIWKFTTQLGTSIKSDEQPTQFSLYQNYPNPFNPTTQIRFSLPQTTHVQLEVYSLLGQRVSFLVNDTIITGTHTVSFDGSNLSSGVYIYRLTTSDYTQSRLMNFVK